MRRLLVGLAVIVLAACSDTPNVKRDIEDEEADLVVVPWTLYVNYDDHPNVAARCDGTTRLYTTTRIGADGLVVVPDHPLCQSGDR